MAALLTQQLHNSDTLRSVLKACQVDASLPPTR